MYCLLHLHQGSDIYQKLASEFAAIEPPVWSSLISKIFGRERV